MYIQEFYHPRLALRGSARSTRTHVSPFEDRVPHPRQRITGGTGERMKLAFVSIESAPLRLDYV